MPIFCTQCGTKNVDGAIFCDECGAKLKTAQPPTPAQPVAPAPAQPVAPAPVTPAPVTPAPAPVAPKRTSAISGGETKPLTDDPFGLQPKPQAKLVILVNGEPVREIPLKEQSMVIGRWDPARGAFPEIDLSADDRESHLSRRHARVYREDDAFFIEDLGSTNGTYVNRTKAQPNVPVPLESGAEIILAHTMLRFERI